MSSYLLYNSLPAYHEKYEKENYNEINNYNTTNCASYKVQDYLPIKIDSLTHGSKQGINGYFNIIDGYGNDSISCDIKTIENYNNEIHASTEEVKYCIWDSLHNKWFDHLYNHELRGVGSFPEIYISHLYKYITFRLNNDHERFHVYDRSD